MSTDFVIKTRNFEGINKYMTLTCRLHGVKYFTFCISIN